MSTRPPEVGDGAASPGRRREKAVGVVLLTVRDLRYRAVRFAAVMAGTAVVMALLFLITGLVEQFHREPRSTVRALGASGWVVREGVSGPFTAGSAHPTCAAAPCPARRARWWSTARSARLRAKRW